MKKRIAGITIELDADTSKLVKKLDGVSRDIDKIGGSFEKVGGDLTRNVTVPVAGAFAGIVKTTADFDSQMSKVQAISGATGDDMEVLRAKAREMGESTKFSATESGEAFEYMAMAGWKTEDMLNGISGIMNLAAASGEELGTTSDIVTDALTAFGLGADQAGRFADVLAATATNSNTNVGQMGEAFKYVAPVAGALGYSVEDVATALGIMANSGIKADMAGTSLRNMFQRMAKPTKESQEAMDRLGISMYDDEGKMYSFREIMEQMRGSFSEINMPLEEYNAQLDELDAQLEDGSITQKQYDKSLEELNKQAFGAEGAEKARAAAMLGGTRAMSGLLAIANTTDDEFNALSDSINNSSGAASDMADVMQDNLSGDITKLMSQLQELAISFGELIVPVLREVVESIRGVVDWMNSLSDEQKAHIMKIAGIVAAVGPVLLIIGKVITAIGTVISIISALSAVFSVLSGPVLIVIAVIAALIAIGVLLYKNWDKIKEKCAELGDWLKEKWENIKEAISEAWENIKNAISTAWENIKTVISNAIEGIKNFITEKWNAIKETVSGIIDSIKNVVTEKWNSIKDGIKNSQIAEVVGNVWSAAKDKMTGFLNGMRQAYDSHGGGLKGAIAATWEGIKSYYKTIYDVINKLTVGKLGEMVSTIKDKMSSIFNSVKDTFERVKDAIKSAIDFIKGLFTGSIDFPHINLPHFHIEGGQAPWGMGGYGYPPQIGIEWYKKAMNNAYMLDGASIFGSMNGKLLGGGETGSEMIIGTNKLLDMIARAKGGEMVFNNQFTINGTDMDPEQLAHEMSYYLNQEMKRLQYAQGLV